MILRWNCTPICTPRAGQETVLLADQATVLVQFHRQHRPRVGRSEGDLALAMAALGVDGGEQAFAGQYALAGSHHLAHEAAALVAIGGAEHGIHLHRGVLEHQRAGLGNGALAGIKLDFHELHFMADDAEFDVVGAVLAAAGTGVGCGGRGLQFGHFGNRGPSAHALAPGQRARVGLRVTARYGSSSGPIRSAWAEAWKYHWVIAAAPRRWKTPSLASAPGQGDGAMNYRHLRGRCCIATIIW